MRDTKACERIQVWLPSASIPLHEFAENALSALRKHDDIYQRGGIPHEIIHGKLVPVSVGRLRLLASRRCDFLRMAPNGDVIQSNITKDRAQTVFDAVPGSEIREIKMVTDTPCYLPGWQMLQPGFNTGGYLYIGDQFGLGAEELVEIRRRAKEMAEMSPDVARDLLLDLCVDFPFQDDASRDNFIAALVTCLVKPALEACTPLFDIEATKARTGKTKLCQECLFVVVYGRSLPAVAYPNREEEREKRITASLMAGQPVIFYDNIDCEVNSPALAMLLTSRTYQGRVLGRSTMIYAEHDTMAFMTSNNAVLGHDMAGRVSRIILVPRDDRPEIRDDFVHPSIRQHAETHRVTLLAAAASMVERWLSEGRPEKEGRVMGSFEKWYRQVGGILELGGFNSFMQGWETQIDSSDDNLDLEDLVAEIQRRHRSKEASLFSRMGMSIDDIEIVARDRGIAFFAEALDKPSAPGRRKALGIRVARILGRPVGWSNPKSDLRELWTIRRENSRVRRYNLVAYQEEGR